MILISGFLWFLDGFSSFPDRSIDDLVKINWYIYLSYTIVFLVTSIWWVHNSESWWEALVARYNEPLDLDPSHFGFPSMISILNIAESSNLVSLTVTTNGIVLRRRFRKPVYIPWERIKKISVDSIKEKHRHAKLEVVIEEGILDIMKINWDDKFNSWIPVSVNIINYDKP